MAAHHTHRRFGIATAAIAMAVGSVPASAYAQQRTYDFDIPSQDLGTALKTLARRSGEQVIFQGSAVRGKRSATLAGRHSVDDAVAILIRGSGLIASRSPRGILVLTQPERTAAAGQSAPTAPSAATPDDQIGDEAPAGDIVVTGSRIERAGFDQPTPTTVVGEVELRQGARANIAQVLNDQPQFRPTTSPQVSIGNQNTGTAPVDLRGLGSARTLTLLNGRRFVGENNLNLVPTNMVKRLEVVTGGASAAWGSGAVAGVVNIILKDDLEGVSLGAQSGISSRGDGKRYSFDGSFGTHFAGGAGHFMVGAEYLDDKGISPHGRRSRPNLGAAIVTLNGQQILMADVNNGFQTPGGLITTTGGPIASSTTFLRPSVLGGMTFNRDGTLRPAQFGTLVPQANAGSPVRNAAFPSQQIGGADFDGLYDTLYASTAFERLNVFARASYDLGNAKIWADVNYGRSASHGPFLPDFTTPPLTISATNPFLSATIRNQLAAAGETSFNLGRRFDDVFYMQYDVVRESKEGAIGIDGSFGKSWKYSAHYSHGEVDDKRAFPNSRIVANLNKAIDAVLSGGQIVCAVNADANPANDDPACRPLNPFGLGNASPESITYVTGTQRASTLSKLDSMGAELQGDPFSLWAGPVTVAVGVEARWEEQSSDRGALDRAGVFGLPTFTSDLAGGFNVKEGFGEIFVPLLAADKVKLDFNGAARYSDYSTSGGIWSWKVGGTANLFDSLLLRATRSRDIRSPGITDLFSVMRLGIGPLVDQDVPSAPPPGYTATPSTVQTFAGGNPDLQPEVSSTLTIGGSFSPSFLPGFNLSIDYYNIKIDGAIATLSATSLTRACHDGNAAACARVIRDPATQTVVTVFANAQNIAQFSTKGLDIEAAYQLPLSRLSEGMPGSLRFRALATYIKDFVFNTGVGLPVDSAGDVGESVANSIPKWRGTFSASYQGEAVGADLRVRYVGGGKVNQLLTALVNNHVDARTYVDFGAQFRVQDRFTVFGNVNNLFDVAPPLTSTGNVHYDVVGRYFSFGARINF
jgi:iron complex outermembrane receptor protein